MNVVSGRPAASRNDRPAGIGRHHRPACLGQFLEHDLRARTHEFDQFGVGGLARFHGVRRIELGARDLREILEDLTHVTRLMLWRDGAPEREPVEEAVTPLGEPRDAAGERSVVIGQQRLERHVDVRFGEHRGEDAAHLGREGGDFLVGEDLVDPLFEPVRCRGAQRADQAAVCFGSGDFRVGVREQPVKVGAACFALEVQCNGSLVAIDFGESHAVAGLVRHSHAASVVAAVRFLDLYDLGAEIGQHHRCIGRSQHLSDFDDLDALDHALSFDSIELKIIPAECQRP